MCLNITRLLISKKSKHTLISPHGIGCSVWSSLTPPLLRLSRTVLVQILITGQFFLSSSDEFASFNLELYFIIRIVSDLQTR